MVYFYMLILFSFIYVISVGFPTSDNFSNVKDDEGGSIGINRLWLFPETLPRRGVIAEEI